MLYLILELVDAVHLIVGSYTGTGADTTFLPVAYWNQCIDIGAIARQGVDLVVHILSSK